LNYATEVTFECGPTDTGVAAFTEAALIIRGCDTVEELLTCGMWPLSEKFGFKVETKETLPPAKGCGVDASSYSCYWGRRVGSTFETRIASVACLLMGNYNIAGHNAYKGLLHGS
jgi:hypothetical protein